MPKYIVERDIPNAGAFNAEQLQGIAQTSCGVSCKMNANVHWLESFVTPDKVYCIFLFTHAERTRYFTYEKWSKRSVQDRFKPCQRVSGLTADAC